MKTKTFRSYARGRCLPLIVIGLATSAARHRQYGVLNADLQPLPGARLSRTLFPLPALERTDRFTTSYIEFDDQGHLFDPAQVALALDTIRAAKSCSGATCAPIALFFYVHGWNNNASEESADPERFQMALSYFAERTTQSTLVPGSPQHKWLACS